MDTMQLLRLIETDPLISDQDLADALNVTAGEVSAAKKRLENDKVICGYRTIINWDRTGAEHCDRSSRSAPSRNGMWAMTGLPAGLPGIRK